MLVWYTTVVLYPAPVGQTAEAEGKKGQIGLETDICSFMQSQLKTTILSCLSYLVYDSVFSCLSFQITCVSLVCFQLIFSVVYSSSLSSGISFNGLSLFGHLSVLSDSAGTIL